MLHFPEDLQIVLAAPIATTNGGIQGDYISTKNAHRVFIVGIFLQVGAHATAMLLSEAEDVAGTGVDVVTATFPIWKGVVAAGDTDLLVRGTDAATVLCTATATTSQILIMEIDPAKLSADHDCIKAVVTTSGDATNFATLFYLIEPRYPQVQPPSAIVD